MGQEGGYNADTLVQPVPALFPIGSYLDEQFCAEGIHCISEIVHACILHCGLSAGGRRLNLCLPHNPPAAFYAGCPCRKGFYGIK